MAPTKTTINFDAIAGDKDDPESELAKALFDAVRAPVHPCRFFDCQCKYADETWCVGCRASGGSLGRTHRAFQTHIPLRPNH